MCLRTAYINSPLPIHTDTDCVPTTKYVFIMLNAACIFSCFVVLCCVFFVYVISVSCCCCSDSGAGAICTMCVVHRLSLSMMSRITTQKHCHSAADRGAVCRAQTTTAIRWMMYVHRTHGKGSFASSIDISGRCMPSSTTRHTDTLYIVI